MYAGYSMLFYINKYSLLALVWVLIISALTIIKVAPENLNADILINSVMSLQKLTLYYWGQNRLLNILPLTTSLVKNPSLNLSVVLMLTSMSFYILLYFISRAAVVLIKKKDEGELSFKVFLITSSVFVFIFTPHAISEMTIGHIEYSFPALLLVFASLKLFLRQDDTEKWRSLSLPVAAIILAIGLNPSTLIPAFFISMATAFKQKKIRLNTIVLLMASGLAFFVWSFVSKQYGSFTYNKFSLEIFYSGVQKVAGNLLSTVNLPILLLLLAFILLGKIVFNVYVNNKSSDCRSIISYSTNAVILFSIGWLLLFSSSRWVEMNQFAWRYFIYIFFALIFLCSVYLSSFLNRLSARKSMIFAGATAFAATLFLASPFARLTFDEYKVFQRVNALTEPGGRLYSGDYWVVWPSVMRDMMHGYETYGLAYRGEANKEAAKKYISGKITENGNVFVFCLNDTIQNCVSLVNSIAGPLYAVGSTQPEKDVYLIEFVRQVPQLEFKGADFLNLPSQVGIEKIQKK